MDQAPTKRVFNNAKVSDHHAIIPTGTSPAHLDNLRRKVFDMVARRTIAVFDPAAQFEVTTRITRGGRRAVQRRTGESLSIPAWKAVSWGKKRPARTNNHDRTPDFRLTNRANAAWRLRVGAKMRPSHPHALTKATLLSAMEGAGKLVEDEELREAR